MKRLISVLVLFVIVGCNSDIVVTPQLKLIDNKCLYFKPLNTENQSIGRVLRDVIEKEFVRQAFELCDEKNATIVITGSAFLTDRSKGSRTFLGGSTLSTQAIESVSLIAKDTSGKLLATASYNNKERLTASELGKKFGKAFADKLK